MTALAPAAPPQHAPLSDTFLLHSRPSATKIIHLDFDGFTTTDNSWGSTAIVTAQYNTDATAGFSNAELTAIQDIWARVAECFSPFDVDVTTQEPASTEDLRNTGGSDTRWGIRVAIGVCSPDPAPTAGGVAFLGSFMWNTDTPCYVFPQRLGNVNKFIADASVHEVGHALGLSHDGRTTPVEGYYQGHGSGVTAWAPHMGVGYYVNLVQWSKGEYANADNTQDDLAIIVDPTTNGWGGPNGFGYRTDDAANSRTAAAPIAGTAGVGVFNIDQQGVVERTTDIDWYKINAGAGSLILNASGGPSNTMLDIQLELYNSTGSLLATSNPTDQLTASISRSVATGTYYVKVEGVGRTGDGSGNPPDQGYSDYGSLGQFRITGSCVTATGGGNVVASYNAATKTLTLTGDARGNGLTVIRKTSPDRIEVAGTTGTKVNNKTTIQSYAHTGQLKLNAVLGDGDDSITMTGVNSSLTDIKLGNGADKATLNLCAVATLKVDGGTGVDTLTTTTSTITNRTVTNVP